MQNKIANTLFIPLIARIHASKNFKQYFYDETAMKFEDKIPQKFLKISSEYESLASAARYYRHTRRLQCRKFGLRIRDFGISF